MPFPTQFLGHGPSYLRVAAALDHGKPQFPRMDGPVTEPISIILPRPDRCCEQHQAERRKDERHGAFTDYKPNAFLGLRAGPA